MSHSKKIKPDVIQLAKTYNLLFTRNNPKNFSYCQEIPHYLYTPNFKNQSFNTEKLKYYTANNKIPKEKINIVTPTDNFNYTDTNIYMPKNITNHNIFENTQNTFYNPEKYNPRLYKTITVSNVNRNNIFISPSPIQSIFEDKNKNDIRYKLFNTPFSNYNENIITTSSNIIPKKLFIGNYLNQPINPLYSNQRILNNNFFDKIYNTNNNISNFSENNHSIIINVDDLLTLEEKLNNILENIQNFELRNDCVEFFIVYFNSTLLNKFPKFFRENNKKIVQTAVNLLLVTIGLFFNISLNGNLLTDLFLTMKQVFNLIRMNYFLFIRKLEIFYGEDFCNKKEIFFHNSNLYLTTNNLFDLNENQIITLINQNNFTLLNIINKNILSNFTNANDFFYIIDNIYKLTEQEIYDYFFSNDDNDNNPQNNENILIDYLNKRISPPYIKIPNKKKYTLVLDIDDTLINIKYGNLRGKNLGVCKFRPGLLHFLNAIKPYYEIISFTTFNKNYSENLIKQIEVKGKYFDYNLCRDHTVLHGNEFIKDISRIGRNIKKIIIVDDEEKNFRLNKANGICICPFLGNNDKDVVLFELKKLLILFYSYGYSDLRNAIKNFKKEIEKKITKGYN